VRTTTARRLPTAVRTSARKTRKTIETPLAAPQPRPELQALFDLSKKPGYYNPAAKSALLRRTQAAPHDELLVDFSQPDCFIELRSTGSALLSGTWTFQAVSGGQPLTPAGPWQESCWETDDACDYLEIELPLSGGWRLERQMLLARRDRFLFLADALLGPAENGLINAPGAGENSLPGVPSVANNSRPANGSCQNTLAPHTCELHYSYSLPLDSQAAFRTASESREGWLESKNRRMATVIPLALPEWRAEFAHAELASDGEKLNLGQKALGRNLYAPLWIDLDPRRLRRPLTWRRITIAENLTTVPRDTAAAYRVQAGRAQWLIYRSLAKAGNRSFLGHNTVSEFVCRRILPSGDTEPIIEIE
jgi:hypothetical protein